MAATAGPVPTAEEDGSPLTRRREHSPPAPYSFARLVLGYEDIVAALVCAHAGSVHRIVPRPVREHVSSEVVLYRQIAWDRRQALLGSVWPRAMAGDVTAVADARCIVISPAKAASAWIRRPIRRPTRPRSVVMIEEDRREAGLI